MLIALLAGGCDRAAAPSPVPSVVPSPPPTAAATDVPTTTPETVSPPPATAEATAPPDLERTTTKTRDDIRVTVTLQRNPMPAGKLSWVKTTVTNVGTSEATWFHDGCANPVNVGGSFDVDWRDGVQQAGQAGVFKDAVLGKDFGEAEYDRPFISFVPKEALAQGSYGCADIGIGEKLAAGASLRATRWWSGLDPATKAPPPGGPVTLDIWAGYFWRGKEPADIPAAHINLTLDAWVTGGWSPSRPSPREIVDAALTDASFADYLETQDIHSGREEILWYDAHEDRWEVGVMPWYETDPPRIHGLLVDATTGAVIGPLDRAWDEDVDGFPY
jgi:hypothetical protein